MEVHSRPAGPADESAVAELLAQSAAAIATQRGGRIFALREGLRELFDAPPGSSLADPAVFGAVGLVDGVILGFALTRLDTLRDGSLLARLEHMWVDPGAREVGLGESMLHLVVSWAAERGARQLDAYALPGNREAKNFLESAGFTARLIVMSRTLS